MLLEENDNVRKLIDRFFATAEKEEGMVIVVRSFDSAFNDYLDIPESPNLIQPHHGSRYEFFLTDEVFLILILYKVKFRRLLEKAAACTAKSRAHCSSTLQLLPSPLQVPLLNLAYIQRWAWGGTYPPPQTDLYLLPPRSGGGYKKNEQYKGPPCDC
jgi:hypothetical protein